MMTEPLRVCFFISSFGDGGAQKQCIFLLNELAHTAGVEVTVVTLKEGVHQKLLDGQIIHNRIGVGSFYDPRISFRLARILRSGQFDILLTWLHAADIHGYAAQKLARSTRWIITERGSAYPHELKYRLRRVLGKHAAAVVSNSRGGDQYWKDAGATGTQYVVNNIVQLPKRSPRRPDTGDIVAISRLEPQKNVQVLLLAFCFLARRRHDLRFFVIGQGSLQPLLERLVLEQGCGSRVKFLGFRADIDDLLDRAGLLVTLSHHEGLPNVLLESVAHGVVVVASAIQEHCDVLGPTYPYLVQDFDNPGAAADVIEAALDGKASSALLAFASDRLTRMGAAAVAASYVRIFGEVKSR